MEITPDNRIKIPRSQLIIDLRERDGNICGHPDCHGELDFNVTDESSPMFVTIDHWYPQWYGKQEGWTLDQIWDLSNLKLMHKKCNAKKGDKIPNDDGTLPAPKTRTFRYRRDKRAARPELCTSCNNGNNLEPDEICAACGSTATPYPQSVKVPLPECDHALTWCWACSIGVIERTSTIAMAWQGITDES